MSGRRGTSRLERGFSLLEAVGVVVILAVAVPASVALVRDAASARADGVALTRGVALASVVIEGVRADVASTSPGLGFAALADATAYTAGLSSRIEPAASVYEGSGLSWTIEIGSPESPDGTISGDPDLDVVRLVRVRVSMPRSRGGGAELVVEGLVGAS